LNRDNRDKRNKSMFAGIFDFSNRDKLGFCHGWEADAEEKQKVTFMKRWPTTASDQMPPSA